MGAPLTIVVTFFDRHSFSPRCLRGLASGFHFADFIFVDSGFMPIQTDVLADFPHKYRYLRTNRDESINDYHRKMFEVLKLVNSPYVALLDNDDFMNPRCVQALLQVLETDSRWVSATGIIMGFSTNNNFPNSAVASLSSPMSASYSRRDPSPNRVDGPGLLKFFTSGIASDWYAIYRTATLTKIFSQLCLVNFQTFDPIPEMYFQIAALACGPHYHGSDQIYLARQQNTSLRTSCPPPVTKLPCYLHDISAVTGLIAACNFDSMTEELLSAIARVALLKVKQKDSEYAHIRSAFGESGNLLNTVHGIADACGGGQSLQTLDAWIARQESVGASDRAFLYDFLAEFL